MKRKSQKHHRNQDLKKENLTQKAWMNNIMGQAIESLSNHGIERNGGHHHMSMIVGTHMNEDCQQNCKYPIFCKNLRMSGKQHMTLLRRRN
jgi:hypothetical protein